MSQSTKAGFGPGGVFAIPKLESSNEVKCIECLADLKLFKLFKQNHHCRNCGNVVCSKCSENRHPLKKFGYENPVRCCNTCSQFIGMQNMSLKALDKQSRKELLKYIEVYNLSLKAAIEKNDLVNIIFNTKPISNENEEHYRKWRDNNNNVSPSSEEKSGLTLLGNWMEDLFSSPSTTNRQHKQAKSRQQQNQQERQRQGQPEEHQNYQQQGIDQSFLQNQKQKQQRRQSQPEQRQDFPHASSQQQSQSRQPPPPEQKPASPQPSPPSSANTNLPSLEDIIKDNIEPSTLSIKALKLILKVNFVKQSHAIEKHELVKLVDQLVKEKLQGNIKKESKSEENNDAILCKICFDNDQNCVFLNCGHMTTCMDCAQKLIVSKNECPICREPILKLVHVFRT